MPNGGELAVIAHSGATYVELEISDSGPGLSDEVRSRAYKPLLATRDDAKSLGLSFVHDVALAHGGDVTVQNCPEGGTAFTIRIPRRAMEAAA
jgi:signal transduction histidine kinase